MKESDIEKSADEAWLIWRRWHAAKIGDPSKSREIDVWHAAYRFGVEHGRDIENEALIHHFLSEDVDEICGPWGADVVEAWKEARDQKTREDQGL